MVIRVGSLKTEDEDEAMFQRAQSQSHATNTKMTRKQGERTVKVENQKPQRSDCIICGKLGHIARECIVKMIVI